MKSNLVPSRPRASWRLVAAAVLVLSLAACKQELYGQLSESDCNEMVAALREVAGDAAAARIVFEPDARVEKIVGSWPGRWDTSRAEGLGLSGERDFADVVRSYIEDEHIQLR